MFPPDPTNSSSADTMNADEVKDYLEGSLNDGKLALGNKLRQVLCSCGFSDTNTKTTWAQAIVPPL